MFAVWCWDFVGAVPTSRSVLTETPCQTMFELGQKKQSKLSFLLFVHSLIKGPFLRLSSSDSKWLTQCWVNGAEKLSFVWQAEVKVSFSCLAAPQGLSLSHWHAARGFSQLSCPCPVAEAALAPQPRASDRVFMTAEMRLFPNHFKDWKSFHWK